MEVSLWISTSSRKGKDVIVAERRAPSRNKYSDANGCDILVKGQTLLVVVPKGGMKRTTVASARSAWERRGIPLVLADT
jgi:hypothetical protein